MRAVSKLGKNDWMKPDDSASCSKGQDEATYLDDGRVLLASLGKLVVRKPRVLVLVHHPEDLRGERKKRQRYQSPDAWTSSRSDGDGPCPLAVRDEEKDVSVRVDQGHETVKNSPMVSDPKVS